MIPSLGRIVEYTLNEIDAIQINRHRSAGTVNQGNRAKGGEKYPMMIVKIWGSTPDSAVNGQVHLDGNDTLWVTSRGQGDTEGQWHEYERI